MNEEVRDFKADTARAAVDNLIADRERLTKERDEAVAEAQRFHKDAREWFETSQRLTKERDEAVAEREVATLLVHQANDRITRLNEAITDSPKCRACEFAGEAAFAGADHDLDRPPHTDPDGPIVLGQEASDRLDEIMASPSGPLPAPPLPMEEGET